MTDKTVIVVQARMSSSRLPGKVMLPILGKSLLFRMMERLKMVHHKVQLIVATSCEAEDDVIERESLNMGIGCFRGSLNNLLDRHYRAAELFNTDHVVKIPSDCPLIDAQVVDDVLSFYFAAKGGYDYVSNLHPATYPDGNDVEIMSMACLRKTWQEAQRPLELEHTTPYIWENPGNFIIGNYTWGAGLDYSMSHRFTIDYEADYQFIKRVYEELYPANPRFTCGDILGLLAGKLEIYNINARYAGVNWYRNHLDELITISAGQTKITVSQNLT